MMLLVLLASSVGDDFQKIQKQHDEQNEFIRARYAKTLVNAEASDGAFKQALDYLEFLLKEKAPLTSDGFREKVFEDICRGVGVANRKRSETCFKLAVHLSTVEAEHNRGQAFLKKAKVPNDVVAFAVERLKTPETIKAVSAEFGPYFYQFVCQNASRAQAAIPYLEKLRAHDDDQVAIAADSFLKGIKASQKKP